MAYPTVFAKSRHFLENVVRFLDKPSLYAVYVFCFFAVFFVVTFMTLDRVLSLDDHFFHIRFAELFRETGFAAFRDFQSIYFSKMGITHEYLVYYNFLFYAALVPFTLITPLIVGMKLYAVTILSTAFTAVYVFLRGVAVKRPFLWTVVFLMALFQSGWFFRFTLARPFVLAPVLLVIMLYCIHRKKYVASGFLALAYFFWHTATFIFPLCLAVGYFLFEQFYGKKPDWRMILWPFAGTVLAVSLAYLISPGVIAYLRDVIFPVFFDTTLTKTTGIAEGGEVYGKNIFTIFIPFIGFLLGLIIAGAYEIARYVGWKRGVIRSEDSFDLSIQPLRAMLFMASMVFFAAAMLSARFLDYFVYFCTLYLAIVFSDGVRFMEIRGEMFRKSLRIGLWVFGLFFFVNLSLNFYDTVANGKTPMIGQVPAEWLNHNLAKNTVVFNVDWDAFPVLYYFTGDQFRYVTGLEPRFLYDLDPEKYWIWNNIGQGLYCEMDDCQVILDARKRLLRDAEKDKWYVDQGEKIADAILSRFESEVVVVSLGHKELLLVMDHSSRFRQEFSDEQNSAYAVYRVLPK